MKAAESAALTFRVADTQYILELRTLAGVRGNVSLRPVRDAPPAVVGVAEWQGRVVTVLDAAVLLGHPPHRGPGCLARLARPFDGCALWLPGTVTLGSAADLEATVRVDPHELLTALGVAS